MMRHMFHLILRPDDCCEFQSRDIKDHPRYSAFCLAMKVSWSKNVSEERACPDQLLLGSNDPFFCLLLSLAIYLEFSMIASQEPLGYWLYNDFDPTNDPDENKKLVGRSIETFGRYFQAQLKKDEFIRIYQKTGGPIGVYGLRKFATEFPKHHGVDREMVNIRGRWKKHTTEASDTYHSVVQPYADAKVAAALSMGGPVKYKLKANSGITDDWICEHVVPHIRDFYGEHSSVPKVLGRALLWAIMDGNLDYRLPEAIRQPTRRAYSELEGRLADGVNPVEKVSIPYLFLFVYHLQYLTTVSLCCRYFSR